MYANQVLLPQFTNREDLLLTLSIFDDDTGQSVNLTGTTLANPQNFTGSVWNVVVNGNQFSTSFTTITIPYFPNTGQLSALALTIAPNLIVPAGSPIIITDNGNPLNQMIGFVTSYNVSTGAVVCQIGMTFQFEIRRGRPNVGIPEFDGYSTSFGLGFLSDQHPLIAAALGTGVSIIDVGFIQVLIPENTFRQLGETGTYVAALTMTDGISTRQIMIGQLPVLDGGVTL